MCNFGSEMKKDVKKPEEKKPVASVPAPVKPSAVTFSSAFIAELKRTSGSLGASL